MRTTRLGGVALLSLAVVMLTVGCFSDPATRAGPTDGSKVAESQTTMPKGPASGASSARTSTLDLPAAPAVAWGASKAESSATNAKYSPTNTNSQSGHLVTGFVMGLTVAERTQINEVIADAIDNDPVIQSIQAELAYLVQSEEYSPEWQTRADQLRQQLQEARDHLIASMRSAGVAGDLDLGNLTTLVNVGIINSATGQKERAPTDEEIRRISLIIPNAINATKGQTQILSKDDVAESRETTTPEE